MQTNNYTKWLVFLGVAFVATMINLDMTVVNLALASIASDFHATLSQMQWVSGIYTLIGIVFMVLAGRLSDVFSRKKIYLLGIVIFTLSSILAGLSINPLMLIVARALQGVGLAMTLTLGLVILTNVFPLRQRGFAIGNYMMVAGFSQALGPTLGGFIIQYLSWRWIFLINIPLSILAMFFIWKFYFEKELVRSSETIDYKGAVFLGMGLISLLIAINELGRWGFSSPYFIGCLILSAINLTVFYFHEKRVKFPLLDFSLFKNSTFSAVSFMRFSRMNGSFAVLFLFPLYLQNIMGFSPVVTGLILLIMTIFLAVLSPVVGKIIDRIGSLKLFIAALLLSVVSLIFLANLGTPPNWFFLVLGLALFGLAKPPFVTASVVLHRKSVPENRAGIGMSTLYLFAFLGAVMGISFSGSLLSIISVHHFIVLLNSHFMVTVTPAQKALLIPVINGVHPIKSIFGRFSTHQLMLLVPIIKQSYSYAFSFVMYLCAALLALAGFGAFFLKENPRG